MSAYGAGGLGAALLGGWLADRLGRRNTIALSMFSAAATMLALSQARGLAPVVVLSGAAGPTSELYRPASAALLTDLLPPGRRITGFALYRLAHRGAARRARPGRSRRPCLPALPPRVACPPPSSTSNSRPRFPSTSPTRASRTPSSEHFSLSERARRRPARAAADRVDPATSGAAGHGGGPLPRGGRFRAHGRRIRRAPPGVHRRRLDARRDRLLAHRLRLCRRHRPGSASAAATRAPGVSPSASRSSPLPCSGLPSTPAARRRSGSPAADWARSAGGSCSRAADPRPPRAGGCSRPARSRACRAGRGRGSSARRGSPPRAASPLARGRPRSDR